MKLRVVLTALALASCAPTLQGQLKGPGGELVSSPDARVNITSLEPSATAPAVVVTAVDANGRFATDEKLPAGDYLVEALVPGYALSSRHVKLAGATTLDLTLKRLDSAKTEATHVNAGLDEGRGAGGATLTPPSL